MRLFLISVVFVILSSCNKDEAPDNNPEKTVDFDVRVFWKNSENIFYKSVIAEGSNLTEVKEIFANQDFGSSTGFNVDGDYFIRYKNQITSPTEVFYANLLTDEVTVHSDYLSGFGENTYFYSKASNNGIVSFFYKIVGGVSKYYFDYYNVSSQNIETTFLGDDFSVGEKNFKSSKLGYAGGFNNTFTIFFTDFSSNKEYSFIGPNSSSSLGIVDDVLLYIEDKHYKIKSIETGAIIGEGDFNDYLNSERIFFGKMIGNKITFEHEYSQPSPFQKGPAYIDFDKDEVNVFDMQKYRLALSSVIDETAYPLEEFALYAQSNQVAISFKFGESNAPKYGVAFLTFDGEFISYVETPFEVEKIALK